VAEMAMAVAKGIAALLAVFAIKASRRYSLVQANSILSWNS
jgi:hypothetical protein